jgi:hypothetical protein
MPVFRNQDNQSFVLLPPGDYVFRVVGMESGIQTGTGKTAGSPFWEFKLMIEGKGANVYERLIDHESTGWKIDTFLKCTGQTPPVNAPFEFEEQAAEAAGVHWINPIGLRGHCALIVEEFTKTGQTEKKKKNRVSVFYTDKPKLPRHEAAPALAPAPAAVPKVTPSDDGLPF